MANIVDKEAFPALLKYVFGEWTRLRAEGHDDFAVVTYCKAGRHRSVAVALVPALASGRFLTDNTGNRGTHPPPAPAVAAAMLRLGRYPRVHHIHGLATAQPGMFC